MPNFVQCDAGVLYDRRVLAVFPNGEAGIFDRDELEWNGTFEYHDQPVKHLALDGKYFWSVYLNETVLLDILFNMSVDLRIGGKETDTFLNPTQEE